MHFGTNLTNTVVPMETLSQLRYSSNYQVTDIREFIHLQPFIIPACPILSSGGPRPFLLTIMRVV